MPEHKYISERVERKTHIKGTFKGKFEGQLDQHKSDVRYERFFDLDIVDGDVYTTPQNLLKWSEKVDLDEFENASSFTVKQKDGIRVTIQSADNTEKYFKLKLKELRLINCRLSQQNYVEDMVYGFLEGDVLSYMLHTDTYINEVEKKQFEEERTFREKSEEKLVNSEVDLQKGVKSSKLIKPAFNRRYWSHFKRPVLAFALILLALLSQNPLLILLTILIGTVLLFKWYLSPRLGQARPFLTRLFSPGYVLSYVFIGLLLLSIYGIRSNKTQTGAVAELSTKKHKPLAKHQKDSFEHHFESGKHLLLENSKKEALKHLEKAKEFASTEDSILVNNETKNIYISLAEEFEKGNQYGQAIEVYSNLVNNNPSDPTFLYNRAVCYVKTEHLADAVKDLKKAIDLGDQPASLLHNQINPLKRKLAYTVIRCRDGTISSSKHRRGTCSHHGGVENWNEEVYEEYREYP